MPARRSRATRTERIITAAIWLLTFTLVGVGVGLFFSSSIVLYLMIAVGVLVAWLVVAVLAARRGFRWTA